MKQLWMLFLLVVTIGGCLKSVSPNPNQGYAWAMSLAADTLVRNPGEAAPVPVPTPNPAPAGKVVCDNCHGTGVVGDGRIEKKCPVCEGTGYVDAPKAEPPAPDPIEAELQKSISISLDQEPVKEEPPQIEIAYPTPEPVKEEPPQVACPLCNCTGKVQKVRINQAPTEVTCTLCGGTGKVAPEPTEEVKHE